MKNSVQLIGHVGQEPEIKNLEGGKKLANISIATNEVYYKDNGDKVEQTQWHRVTAWGKTADIIERFVTKGKEIAIEGKLTHRSYDDKDGNKRYTTEIVASDMQMLGSKEDGARRGPAEFDSGFKAGGNFPRSEGPVGEDDIPF